MTWLALVGALLGPGQFASARAETGWVANEDDALLFDVRLGQWRLGDGVRGYQTSGGMCVDLADMIMALDISVRLDKKLRRATGWAFKESNTLTIDREANIVQIMNTKKKLVAGQIFDTPEGWCVNTEALANWLGIKLEGDISNALLRVKSDDKLPVEMSAERRARAAKIRPMAAFDLKTLPQAKIVRQGISMPSVDAVVTLGASRYDGSKASPELRYELYASGEAGPVAYDARLASNRSGVPDTLRVRAHRIDPNGQALGKFVPATQVAVGDVTGYTTALVSQANIGRGALITNRPLDRPDSFDRTDFRGELPAGWDAELYRNGQLLAIAVDRADGRYEFVNIPMLYGQNRFEIILYGPQGQTRREEKTVMVGFDSVLPGKTWYWAGVNQDGRDLVGLGDRTIGTGHWRGTFGVEHGINTRTSASIAFASLYLKEVGRRNFSEVAVRRAIGPALIELAAATNFGSGVGLRAHMLSQFGTTYLTADSMFGLGGFTSDRVLQGLSGRHELAIDRNITLGRTIVPLHADVQYLTYRDGQRALNVGTRASANFGRFTLTNETDWRHSRSPLQNGSTEVLETAFLGNARFGRMRLRGETRIRLAPDRRFESANIIGEWTGKGETEEATSMRGEIGYDRGQDRARLGFGYVRRFEKFALTGTAEVGSDKSFGIGINLAFSLGPDPRKKGHFRVSSSHQASMGQILARVYRDVNGDGQRQADEPLEKEVQLAAGRVPVRKLTDEQGSVIIEDAQPYLPILIGVDAGSLPDPLIQPSGPGLVVTPRPGVTAIVDLPLVGAGEVDGTLVGEGGAGLEGVDLELVDQRGAVIRKTRSDFDGFFLFETVPYGKYSVRIGKASADIAQLNVILNRQAEVSADQASAHLGVVAATSDKGDPKMATGP